jgi:hypothetical protein
MTRFWTCHWQKRFWRPDVNREHAPCCSSGSNSFRKRGVSVGDLAYIISITEGQLLLGGRMTVKRIVSRDEAVRIWGSENLYDAEEWIVDEEESGTPLNLHRRLAPEVTRRLRFLSPKRGQRPLFFKSNTQLDGQTTRGVYELTAESAALLDRIIDITDRLPKSDQWITVTEELLECDPLNGDEESVRLPEEVPEGAAYPEGRVHRILVNRYERDPRVRDACISHYGATCSLCGFDFGERYGELMAGVIHVHHLIPLSSVDANYEVDPIRDLRPVCPNCHVVLHHREPPYSLEEARQFLQHPVCGSRERSDG